MGGVWKALASRAALPEEVFKDGARLTLSGGEQVRIENRSCLLSFAPDAVEVGCGRLRLRILGSGLQLCGMDAGELLICGRIQAVEVEGA